MSRKASDATIEQHTEAGDEHHKDDSAYSFRMSIPPLCPNCGHGLPWKWAMKTFRWFRFRCPRCQASVRIRSGGFWLAAWIVLPSLPFLMWLTWSLPSWLYALILYSFGFVVIGVVHALSKFEIAPD